MNLPPFPGSAVNAPKPVRFDTGRIVATRGATALFARAAVAPYTFLNRHIRGDWGKVDDEDAAANEAALKYGARVVSVYDVTVPYPDSARTTTETLWIITEADRSVTTLLLPEEY